ncbi:MAG TPA: galactokinase [Pseudonocardiaceae bacterium]
MTGDLAARFAAAYGRPPQGVWAAPGRVNLIGEHTDYNDGFVLPLAIPLRVRVAAARRADDEVRAVSAQAPGGHGWLAYVRGMVAVLRAAGHPVGGLDLLVDGEVPLGAGLSSSAALCCAVGLAAVELSGAEVSRVALARAAQRTEHEHAGAPVGIMDPMVVLHATAGHALFLDTRSLAIRAVPLALAGHGLSLLVVDTRAPHRLVDGEYARRRRSCELAAAALGVPALRDATAADLERLTDPLLRRRSRHVVTENERVLTVASTMDSGADPRRIGPLLTASHASLRDDFAVSCPELDTAVDAALAAGAHGARMTGGGFGGCAIALIDTATTRTVTEAVTAAFAARGFRPPHTFPAEPSTGATREA